MIKIFLLLVASISMGVILLWGYSDGNALVAGFGVIIVVLCIGFCGVIQAIESLKVKGKDKKEKKTDSP